MVLPIKSMLDRFLKKDNDWRMRVVKDWPQIMGRLYDKVSVEKIERKTLYLVTYDSCWLTELHMLSRFIIKNVNDALGSSEIAKVHFSLKSKKNINSFLDKKPQVLSEYVYQLTNKEQIILNQIKDESLQNALESFLKRCKHHA